jgi:hypothetical protein
MFRRSKGEFNKFLWDLIHILKVAGKAGRQVALAGVLRFVLNTRGRRDRRARRR